MLPISIGTANSAILFAGLPTDISLGEKVSFIFAQIFKKTEASRTFIFSEDEFISIPFFTKTVKRSVF